LAYDDDLDLVPDESFDLIFTKSVLVVVPSLHECLTKIDAKLEPGGSAIFSENGYGDFVLHALRKYRHKGWDYSDVHYFRDSDRAMFEDVFDSVNIKKTLFPPPVHMFYCKKSCGAR